MSTPKLILVAALCSAALSACVVAPYPRPYGYGSPSGEVIVADLPPPAPYAEVVPVAPFVGALWIGGYWGWNGGRHAWVGGHYEAPRPGYSWQPHRWVPHEGRWRLEGGGWVRH
jgi:WXXGXW repeat (2 copies)